jgi:hypothetical protein
MTSELTMMAICGTVVCLLLVLRSLIFAGRVKSPGYRVWIMNSGDNNGGDDSSALDDWPAEIEVPADFFTKVSAKAGPMGEKVGN